MTCRVRVEPTAAMAAARRWIPLDHFNPADTDPLLLVNREADREWLTRELTRYLSKPPPHGSASFCITGEKGVGKSILTRAALRDVRKDHSDHTLFLEIDCRKLRSAREVIAEVAQGVVEALIEMRPILPQATEELVSTARVLSTVARFDEVELKELHEHLVQYKSAVGLKTERSLLSSLNMSFQISLERSVKTVKDLTGKVRLDEHRLGKALCALFHDVCASGLDIVLWLDNIDELQHSYRTGEDRARVRLHVEALLGLCDAPIALVLAMRSYYSGILPRQLGNRRILRPLPEAELLNIAHRRLQRESEDAQKAMLEADCKEMIRELAQVAPTPLAFITWLKFLFEEGMLVPAEITPGLERYLEAYYANLSVPTLRRVVKAFEEPHQPVPRQKLLDACEGNEALFAQLQNRQAVLPVDFWDPVEFTLDPELFFLHPKRAPVGKVAG